MSFKKHKFMYLVLLIMFLIFGILSVNYHDKSNTKELSKDKYYNDQVNLKKEYSFEEIDALNNASTELKTRPDYLGFTNGSFFIESNLLDKKLIRKSNEVYKYDFISYKLIELIQAKPDIKVLSASEINDKVIYSYIDCNSIKSDEPFDFYISTYENGKEKVLLKYTFGNDTIVPHFVYSNNALYFFVPELIKEKNKAIEDSTLSMILYKYNGNNLKKVYSLETPIKGYQPVENANYIVSTDLIFNQSNIIAFQEFSKNGTTIKLVEDDKVYDIPLKSENDTILCLLKDDLLVYNSISEEYGFLNIKTAIYQNIGKLGRIYEISNYNDEYIIFLKEDLQQYFITRNDLIPNQIVVPQIFDKDFQRTFIFTDGKNILLQISDMNSNLASFYKLRNMKD